MTIMQLKRGKIRGKYIEKVYVCPKCKTEYKERDEIFYCPNCSLMRVQVPIRWKLKDKYASDIEKIFKDIPWLKECMENPNVIFRDALKLLVEAINDVKKDTPN